MPARCRAVPPCLRAPVQRARRLLLTWRQDRHAVDGGVRDPFLLTLLGTVPEAVRWPGIRGSVPRRRRPCAVPGRNFSVPAALIRTPEA